MARSTTHCSGSSTVMTRENFYQDCLANSFDSWYRESRDVWSPEREMRDFIHFVLDARQLPTDSRVLDIGAGRGADTTFLLEHSYQVSAIDLCRLTDWDVIEERYGESVKFVQGDFIEWAAPDNSFALVVDNGCFHHQHPNVLNMYLEKIFRLLEPGGVFAANVFFDPCVADFRTLVLSDGRLVHVFDAESLRLALMVACFEEIQFNKIPRHSQLFPYDYLYALAVKPK